jgi:peptide/nickel transport system substrate-binding protein
MASHNCWIDPRRIDSMRGARSIATFARSLLVSVGLLLFSGHMPGGAADAKTLRIALSDDATTLDPHVADLIVNNRLLHNIYDGLVTRDKDFKIAPALAVSWSQPDAKTWRFKLRPNVKFHDGSPFTADDVVFSFNRVIHPLSALRSSVLGVASARRVDDLTVDFIMAEPNAVLLNHLVSFRIMSKAWSAKHGSTNPQNYKDKEETFAARNTNGTGPFRLVSRQPDVRTVLAEHRAWWGRAPNVYASEMGNLTQVEWVPIKSTATRIAALLSGTVDLVLDPPVQDRDRIKNTQGFKLQLGSEPRVFFLAMDVHRDELLYSNVKGKNPFKDLRVRQAMALAVDVDLLVKKVNRGYGRPTALIVGKEVQGYAAELDRRSPADVSRARKLMAEAGYAHGFEVTLDCLNQVPFSEFCQGILPMLAQIGIRPKLNLVSFTNIFPKLQKFDTSFYIMGYGAQPMDALAPMQSLLRSVDEKRSDVNNWGRYNNRQLDALFVKIGREQNMAARDALIREALMLVRDDLPVIPLIQTVHAWAMRSNVDAPFVPNSLPYFYRFSVK